MAALPQSIQDDITDLSNKIGQLQTDQAALPALAAAATQADGALAAGQAAVTNDTTAVNASLAKLQADVAALESPPKP